jgi:WD40 repeat protein
VRDPLGGVGGAARRVFEVEWDERTRAVAGKLVDARLLTTGRDEATRQSTVEVAHEALIWAWPRLRDLVREHGELISWYDGDFAPWLQRWDAEARPSELLLRGGQLDAAHHWLAAVPEMLTGAPADFIEASLAQRAEEEERRRREAERERERERALQVSESLRLASEAREAAEREPETAFLVAWEALLRDRNELSEAVFRVTLDRMPAPVQALWPANSGRETPDFTADGRWVFALDQAGGALELWRVGDGERGRVPVPGTGEFLAAVVPGSDRIVSYRGESLRLHAPDTGTVAELEPFGAGSVDVIYSDLTASRDGRRCVVHLEDRAWLVELDEAGLRLLAAYALQAPRVVEWDGVRHQPGSTVFAARLDREGRTILTEGSDGVCLWDDDGEVRARLSGAESPASAAILDAGVVVTGGQDGEGRLWDTSGQPLATFRESGEEGIDLFVKALHPDGETFAAVVHYTDIVGVWSSTGDRLALLRHERALAAAFSHDGERLATGAPDGTVRVWDWRSQQQLSDLHGHDGAVKDVAFHPADRSQLLSADQGGGVRLWRLETGIIQPLAGHTGPVRSPIAVTAAGVLSRSDDGTTRLWPPNGAPTVLEGELLSRTGGRAVTGTETGAAKLWELEDGGARLVCESQPGGVAPREAVLSPDGSHFAVLAGGEGQLWNAAGDLVRSLRDDDDPGVESPRRQLEGVGFDADGARVAAASENGTVWIWKINGERNARFLADFSSPDRILSVAFDPLGELIACGVRKRTGLWSWDGELVRDLNVGGYKVFTVAFSPDGQRILTIADDPSGRPYVLELWERGGERVAQLDAPGAGLGEPLFDPGSRFFALRADGGIAVFGRDGTRLGVLAGARGVTSTAAAVSPDGGLVAAAFSDGVVRIWSHAGQRRTATLAVGEATAIAFDGGGRLLVGTPGGAIQPYLLDVEALFHPAAQRVDRVLTKDELARFGISEPLLTPERLRRERNV